MSNTCVTCGQVVQAEYDVITLDEDSMELICAALEKYATIEITDGDRIVYVILSRYPHKIS